MLASVDGESICETENRLCTDDYKADLIDEIVRSFISKIKIVSNSGKEPDLDLISRKITKQILFSESRMDEIIKVSSKNKKHMRKYYYP